MAVLAGCMVPAGASASTLYTLSNQSAGTFTTGTGVTSITYGTLTINGSGTSGTFTEVYSNSTGTLTISGTDAALGFSGTLITIQDSPAVSVAASDTNLNLYGAVSTITLTGTTSVLPSQVIAENFDITTGAATGGVSQVTAATASLTIAPEPSTFAMFGLGLLAAASIPARRKLSFARNIAGRSA
jgi:hypothetical protein